MDEIEEEPTGLAGLWNLLTMPVRIFRQEGKSLVDFAREAKEAVEADTDQEDG